MSQSAKACYVCGKNAHVYFHASDIAPISFSSCLECLTCHAEHEGIFEYLYDLVDGQTERLGKRINNLLTWKDGRYVTWTEWVELRNESAENA